MDLGIEATYVIETRDSYKAMDGNVNIRQAGRYQRKGKVH